MLIKFFLVALKIYLLIGLLFGLYFSWKGAVQLDSSLKQSRWTLRLLFLPGALILWPLLLLKLMNKNKDA